MEQNTYFTFVNVRKYLRIDQKNREKEDVSVSNRNALPVVCHMELLNLNDEGYIYLECVGDNFDNLT